MLAPYQGVRESQTLSWYAYQCAEDRLEIYKSFGCICKNEKHVRFWEFQYVVKYV